MKASFAWQDHSEKHNLTVRVEEHTHLMTRTDCIVIKFDRPLLGLTTIHARFADAYLSDDEDYLVVKDPYMALLIDLSTETAHYISRPDPWWIGQVAIEEGQIGGNYYQLEPKRIEKQIEPVALADIADHWEVGIGPIKHDRMPSAHEPFVQAYLAKMAEAEAKS